MPRKPAKPVKKAAPARKKIGAPTKYSPEMLEIVGRLSLMGKTDAEMAEILEIGTATFTVWKRKYPEFRFTIRNGKDIADSRVTESLYKRACGYDAPEVEGMRHIPPDTAAAFIWLKNRQGWRDKIDVDQKQEVIVKIDKIFEKA